MSKEMTFNGVDMSQFFRITDIIRPVGNKRAVSTDGSPTLGVNVLSVDIGPKEHTIKFDLKTSDPVEMEQLKHDLAGVLNVSNPVKITYRDEPDKYYLGMVEDDITPDNLARWFQRTEIKILIPDGTAHSISYRSIVDSKQDGNRLTFDIDNNGNTNAQPIITVKHNAENGYIAAVNETGVFEMGDRGENDGKITYKSELLLDYTKDGTADHDITVGLKNGLKNVAITNDVSERTQTNSIMTDTTWGRNHISINTANKVNRYQRAGLTWNLPADHNGVVGGLYDYVWWRQIIWAGRTTQRGMMKIIVTGENDEFLYGVETIKRGLAFSTEYNALVSNGQGGYRFAKRWTFSPSNSDSQNPFNQNRGWSDMRRKDDKVTFYWWGGYYDIDVPEIKGKVSKKLHVYWGLPENSEKITHLYLDRISFTKDNSAFDEDIPNKYQAGSRITINSEDDTVKVNHLPKISDRVVGSDFITFPPGNSKLEVYYSEWATIPPTVEVQFEERWL